MTLWTSACSYSELQIVRRSHGLVHELRAPVVNYTHLYHLEVTVANEIEALLPFRLVLPLPQPTR